MKPFVWVALMGLIACGTSSCGTVQVARDVSLDDVMKMPPFKAKVEQVEISHPLFLYHGVDIWMTRDDSGKHLNLNICPANDFVLGFARSLHKGETYSFPDVFGDYVNGSQTNFAESAKSSKRQ